MLAGYRGLCRREGLAAGPGGQTVLVKGSEGLIERRWLLPGPANSGGQLPRSPPPICLGSLETGNVLIF